MLLYPFNWKRLGIFHCHYTVVRVSFNILIDITTNTILSEVVVSEPSEHTTAVRDINVK